jgi:polyisoprenoid-binding protein YceI
MSRGIKIFIAIAAGLVVLVVGGAFIYSAIDEAPPKLALTNETTTTGDTVSPVDTATTVASPMSASGDISGAWTATSKSIVGYRVNETLAGSHNEAYGRTSKVTGTMTIAGTNISAAEITADMTTVASDRTQRDGQFRGRIMETSRYPTATFKLTSPIALGSIPATGSPVTKRATGALTLHGVSKTVTFDIKAQRTSSGTIEANGQIPIVFADYNVSDPSGGPAQTEDHGILEFLVVFTKA